MAEQPTLQPPVDVGERTPIRILEQAAAEIRDWLIENPDRAHIRFDGKPGSPDEEAFWSEIEEEIHDGTWQALCNTVDAVGGPVAGVRDLGQVYVPRRPKLTVAS